MNRVIMILDVTDSVAVLDSKGDARQACHLMAERLNEADAAMRDGRPTLNHLGVALRDPRLFVIGSHAFPEFHNGDEPAGIWQVWNLDRSARIVIGTGEQLLPVVGFFTRQRWRQNAVWIIGAATLAIIVAMIAGYGLALRFAEHL